MHAVGSALCITPADFARLRKFLAGRRIPYGVNGRRRAETSGA